MHPDFEFSLIQRSECCNICTKLLLHHQGNSGQIQQLTNQTIATNATNTTVKPKNAINKQTNQQTTQARRQTSRMQQFDAPSFGVFTEPNVPVLQQSLQIATISSMQLMATHATNCKNAKIKSNSSSLPYDAPRFGAFAQPNLTNTTVKPKNATNKQTHKQCDEET